MCSPGKTVGAFCESKSQMISEHAVVETTQIGHGVEIAEFAIVRPGAVIGNNVILHPYTIVNSYVRLCDNVEVFPGAIVGKEPKGTGALVRNLAFERHLLVGANCVIGPHAILYYGTTIGENTLIGDGASIREGCTIGSRCIIGRYVTFQFDVSLGDNSRVLDHSTLAGRTKVGSRAFISFGVYTVGDNAFNRSKYIESETGGPIIEDDVSIGAGALLHPRIVIGKRAIVASGAVVTKDVEPDTLVMGIPARFVRKLNID